MRLRKIRLCGFKSFVDPTTLVVPGNLVGVVGPNGCGKSNIIDAVMWVMGESSAKHLRGDDLTDVIFNGSNSRQPVGQAFVELVFDNTEQKLGGQYASYNEISVKRQLDREGISNYFLNGTRCRRKDVQSLFLGTGLGPRSYAIIEQGMISRLIEAKPDELRAFIEEAAGISKYRERRRETENRMRHTRENLARLNDIREELEKQLEHLQRQARAAERFQSLRREERQLKAELLALNWRALKALANQRAGVVRQHENRVEERLAALRAVESEIERLRDEFAAANESHSNAQARFYEVGSQLSQLAQKIQHGEDRIQTLEGELGKARHGHATAEQQFGHDQARLREMDENAKSLEPKLLGSRSDSNQAYDALNMAEGAIQAWQGEWDACNEAIAELSRQIEVDATRMHHLEVGLEENAQRRVVLTGELESIDADGLMPELERLSAEATRLDSTISSLRREIDKRREEVRDLRGASDRADERLALLRSRHQELAGQSAALRALQGAGAPDSKPFHAWLEDSGLRDAPRLVNGIQVDPEWSLALETVLGARLQDLCAENFADAIGSLEHFKEGSIGLIGPRKEAARAASRGHARLLDLVSSEWQVDGLVGGVLAAENLQEAIRMRAALKTGESVVTRDGIWLGPDWARVHRPAAAQDGMLARERRLQAIETELAMRAREIQSLESDQSQQRRLAQKAEEALAAGQRTLQDTQALYAEIQSAQAESRTRLQASREREAQIRGELNDLELQAEEERNEVAASRCQLDRTDQDRHRLSRQREQLVILRDRHRQALDQARARWQSTHEHSHEIALRLESISSQRASLAQAIQRTEHQLSSSAERMRELDAGLAGTRPPLMELKQSLELRLGDKIKAERELAAARERVQSFDAAVRDKERARSDSEQGIEDLRRELESARLGAQEVIVRVQTLEEQLEAVGQQAAPLLEKIEEQAAPADWQARLEAVERRIQRLGPINLAAIEEYQQLSERKQYLDRQHADLTEALSTLENAIRKIDKESRTRFKETFDRLNGNLKEMFPLLFGGGHAYLEMTGEDLLETGVTVMARPPGKRNSNIHLLSGGEKALTAVALVFAIFKLNPAPFCILDEVDAPLDDTNVGRFSNLLAEMSRDVQFIFVTHNKITMEIAQQLLGVTMQEAGVSRLVSVNVDEAVQLAATA